MDAEYERRLLAQARELADLSDLTDTTLQCLGAARHAGLDPDALSGLVGCAATLGADSTATYSAGDGWTGRHPDERAFLTHVSDIEDGIEEHLGAVARLGREVSAAWATACEDLDAARAMPLLEDCDGCHGRRDAAIADAETRISLCETAGRILQVLRRRLLYARARIRAVPADLGETYESVYNLIRRGGHMPYEGRFITGEEVPA